MIAQEQKPLDEIRGYIRGKDKIVLYGCGGCATVFHTGGEAEVAGMEETLTEHGKKVLAAIAPPSGEFTCYLPWSRERLEPYREEVDACDAMLMMCCGDGLQTVWEHIVEDEFDLNKPLYPATNPIGHIDGGPEDFQEKCQQCGECELGRTAGICPLTQCPKSMLNGPCGGVGPDGTCEVDSDRTCAWVRIYRRLKAMGELDQMREIQPPKDWSAMSRPRQIHGEPPQDERHATHRRV